MNTQSEKVQEQKQPEYDCYRRDIDQFPTASHDVWSDLPKIYLKDTVDGSEPTLATSVESFWTEDALYFRFTCEDDYVRATMTNRDDPIYKEDVVEVFLDETGQFKTYKEFELSPINVQFDALISYDQQIQRVQRVNTEWDAPGWRTEIYPGDQNENWACVWKIPFSVFEGGTPSVGDVWRMNCYRIDRRNKEIDEYTAWSPTGARQFHVPHRFGYLRFAD